MSADALLFVTVGCVYLLGAILTVPVVLWRARLAYKHRKDWFRADSCYCKKCRPEWQAHSAKKNKTNEYGRAWCVGLATAFWPIWQVGYWSSVGGTALFYMFKGFCDMKAEEWIIFDDSEEESKDNER